MLRVTFDVQETFLSPQTQHKHKRIKGVMGNATSQLLLASLHTYSDRAWSKAKEKELR